MIKCVTRILTLVKKVLPVWLPV